MKKEITDRMLDYAVRNKAFYGLGGVARSRDGENVWLDINFDKYTNELKEYSLEEFKRVFPNVDAILVVGKWVGEPYKMHFELVERSERMCLADAVNIAEQRFNTDERLEHWFYVVSARSVLITEDNRIKRNKRYEEEGSDYREE